jgi:plastocyanin
MQFTTSTIAAILLHTAPIFAATHKVNVGGNKQLTFTPTSVTAAVGDTVQYVFQDQNHTVTAGSPNAGCQPSGQFNSGFVPVPATGGGAQTTFSVQVQNTQPITVYCAQAQHCQVGMVMVINPSTTVSLAPFFPSVHLFLTFPPPQGATSLKAYTKLCAGAKTNTPAQGVNGGTLANPPAATTSTTGTTAAKGAKGAKGGKGGKKGGKKAAGAAGATGAGAGAASGAASGAGAGAGAGAATGGAAKGAAGAAGGAAPCAKGKKTARLLRA